MHEQQRDSVGNLAFLVDVVLSRKSEEMSLLSYAIGEIIPLTTGAQLAFALMDVFVPLVCEIV